MYEHDLLEEYLALEKTGSEFQPFIFCGNLEASESVSSSVNGNNNNSIFLHELLYGLDEKQSKKHIAQPGTEEPIHISFDNDGNNEDIVCISFLGLL